MLTDAVTEPLQSRREFASTHPSDGALFLAYIALIWIGMVLGFGGEIARHVKNNEPPYPVILHVHSAVFVTWLIAFTAQILLIRTGKPASHRRLGIAMTFGVGVLAIVGPWTAYAVQNLNFGTSRSDPAFFSVQLGDVIGFVGLSIAAIILRKQAAAHKRLMLLAILQLSTAGFSRWLGNSIGSAYPFGYWGQSFWATFLILHLTNDMLALGIGVYDLRTRGRLHPAYVAGLAWGFGWQVLHVSLYLTPAWLPVAKWLLGR
ncbi:hypothetical protein [Duganella sp. S19_KUP01_CR8]|uniref:hypothetical protein n=1 Tax=Duganella sp. S19_KUP01_CR8 TaxID=3025502 RepID=UPI002FCD89F5